MTFVRTGQGESRLARQKRGRELLLARVATLELENDQLRRALDATAVDPVPGLTRAVEVGVDAVRRNVATALPEMLVRELAFAQTETPRTALPPATPDASSPDAEFVRNALRDGQWFHGGGSYAAQRAIVDRLQAARAGATAGEIARWSVIELDYVNWKGVFKTYHVRPTGRIVVDREYHPSAPYCIEMVDVRRNVVRNFDPYHIKSWKAEL